VTRELPALLVAACSTALLVSGCKSKEKAPPEMERGRTAAERTTAGPSASSAPVAVAQGRVLAELATSPDGSDGAPPPAAGGEFLFAKRGGAVAWIAGSGAESRVVHNGRPGPGYRSIGLLALSSDGRRLAYSALGADGKWRVVVDGVERGPFAMTGPLGFSPDGAHVAYTVKDGAGWHHVVDGVQARAAGPWLFFEFAANAPHIAYVEAPEGELAGDLVLADLSLERRTVVERHVMALMVNGDGTRIAAVGQRQGRLRIVSLPFDRPGDVTREREYDDITGFDYVLQRTVTAYLAERDRTRFLVLGQHEVPAPKEAIAGYPVPTGDEKGVGAFVSANEGAVLFREFFVDGAGPEAPYDDAESLVYAAAGRAHAYAARKNDRWFVVANGRAGPAYDRVVTPAFSPDGKYLVYRVRRDGKRFVVVADASGKVIREHAAYEQVFPVQFTADGRSVAYGVKDGRMLAWKVEPL